MSKIDYDIMGSCIVDHSVDHDILNSRPRVEVKEEVKVEKLREMDLPLTQIQIIEI